MAAWNVQYMGGGGIFAHSFIFSFNGTVQQRKCAPQMCRPSTWQTLRHTARPSVRLPLPGQPWQEQLPLAAPEVAVAAAGGASV